MVDRLAMNYNLIKRNMKRTTINTSLVGVFASFLLGGVGGGLLSSCQFEDEDYFDTPAALRIEQATANIQQTLCDAPNGWVMQYFTGTDEVEGFNIMARFNQDGKVTLAGNHRFLRDGRANKYTEYSSLYQLLREDGPVLAFNTWNDVLTPLVDPVDYSQAPNALVKDGKGMFGDHNFVVLSCDKDEINLRGERYGAAIRLIPCDGEWEDYLSRIAAMKQYIAGGDSTNFIVSCDTDTAYFKNLNTGVITYCERIVDPLFPTTINCLFTPSGIRLHHENSIGDVKFQEFHLSADSTCLVSENDSVRLTAIWQSNVAGMFDNLVEDKSSKVLELDYASLSAQQQTLYDNVKTAVAAINKNYELRNICVASTNDGGDVRGLIVTFYTAKNKKSFRDAALGMTLKINADYSVIIGFDQDNAPANLNMTTLGNSFPAFKQAVHALAASLTGTYTMEPDNYFVPSHVSFNAVGGGNSFKLRVIGQ